jgi:predicted RecA/RadA family phage recombinase
MANNYVNSGETINYVNSSGSAILSGAVVIVGNLIGIALVDIANGESGVVALDGVFTVPKVSAAVIGQGESVIFDLSALAFDDNAATPATGDVSGCCIAVDGAGAGVLTLDIKLNVGVGVVA